MSKIRSKNTRPELLVRKYLHSMGLRYKLHVKDMPGKPDLVLPKYNTVVFVHGCFWHGHTGCKYFVIPKTRTEWWSDKIEKNIAKDKSSIEKLTDLGWRIFEVWECELKMPSRIDTLDDLCKRIQQKNINLIQH